MTLDDYRSAGGVVGYQSDSNLYTSFATGTVSASGVYKYGGVCGYVVQGGSGNYWDTESTGQSSGCGGAGSTGLTTSEMQGETAESNMSNLDFNTIWTTVEGDYPQLQDNPE